MAQAEAIKSRWTALDALRGLSIIFMMINLNPGSWVDQYGWVEHAHWAGWTLIDMVAPVFLFCVGAVIPLSLEGRWRRGASRGQIAGHVLIRAAILVVVGLVLNGYPHFDLAQLRIAGVLQRIGIVYALVSLFLLYTARARPGELRIDPRLIALSMVVVIALWAALLYLVPVPGYGPARLDPVGNWSAVIDRLVIGPAHMFPWWPVDGKVVFDPEGPLTTWPALATVLAGALVGRLRALAALPRPILAHGLAGAILLAAALLLHPISPIIKNLWSPAFILLSAGFALATLAVLELIAEAPPLRRLLTPAVIFGINPFLAYILTFLIAPLFDWAILPGPNPTIRTAAQAALAGPLDPRLASLLCSLTVVAVIFAVLWLCHRRKWILKL